MSKYRILISAFLSIPVLLLSGCAKNYSGQYIGISQEVKAVYKNDKGQIYKEPPLALSLPAGLHTYYTYTFIKNILSLKQEKDGFTGNFIITDDKSLVEFVIKTGYVDKDKRLHLKMTWKPDVNVGVGFMGFSASTSLGEMLLNFDEIPSPEKSKIAFKVSGAMELLSGLFSSDGFQTEQTLLLEKYQEAETENEISKYKKHLAEIDNNDLQALIKEKNYYGAMVSKDLMDSLGESVPEQVTKAIDATKEAYEKEMPEAVKKSIKFTQKEVAKVSSFGSENYKLTYEVENPTGFKIGSLGYSISCKDNRNNKVFDTGKGYIVNMSPKSRKTESQFMLMSVPEQFIACEYKVAIIELPKFTR